MKFAKNTICDTCSIISGKYKICDIFPHTVVISRKTVKICDIFPHTVVISCKKVKSAKNTLCDTCSQNSRRYKFFKIFVPKTVISRRTLK